MSKELPYFKFEPAEYLTKNISFCSLQAQGLFINICSYYWQRNCKLTVEQMLKRLNHKTELDELINEGVIDLKDNFIVIKFLDSQLVDVEKTSKINSMNGAKGGRPKKQTKSENKPTALISLSETKGIREDKIKEDKDNSIVIDVPSKQTQPKKSLEEREKEFRNEVGLFLKDYSRETLKSFFNYWTEPNPTKTKMRYELQKTFDIKRRLVTWNNNNFENKNGNNNQSKKLIL